MANTISQQLMSITGLANSDPALRNIGTSRRVPILFEFLTSFLTADVTCSRMLALLTPFPVLRSVLLTILLLVNYPTKKVLHLFTFLLTVNSGNAYEQYSKLPPPPLGVFCYIRLGRKSALVAVHAFDNILAQMASAQARAIPATEAEASSQEGGT